MHFVRDYDTWRDCQDALLSIVRNDSVARTKERIEDQLLAAFEGMDSDKNGTVELDELIIAISKTEFPLSSEETNALMQEADLNNDKHITFDEFKSAMLHIFAESGLNLYGSFITNGPSSRNLKLASNTARKGSLRNVQNLASGGRLSLDGGTMASKSSGAGAGTAKRSESRRRLTHEGVMTSSNTTTEKSDRKKSIGSIAVTASVAGGEQGGGGEQRRTSFLDTTASTRTPTGPSRSATPRDSIASALSAGGKRKNSNTVKLAPISKT
jgi:hypothetical protein